MHWNQLLGNHGGSMFSKSPHFPTNSTGGWKQWKIRPLYDRIVVKRIETEIEKTHGGLYIPDSAKEKPQEGEVIVAISKEASVSKTGCGAA